MLQKFAIDNDTTTNAAPIGRTTTTCVPRWRAKLFTKEDPIGVHKYLGIFCLLHFAFRFAQMLAGDPSAGLGTRLGRGPSVWPLVCVIPHGLLSLSSLIFHTVPRDRVVGKPMIWREFRAHNIVFGLRSVLTTLLAAWAIRGGGDSSSPSSQVRRLLAVTGSATICLTALVAADVATAKLRSNHLESTTATMPCEFMTLLLMRQRRRSWCMLVILFVST